MAKTNSKVVARIRRKKHIRKRVSGTAESPRLTVFRSGKHIYAQLVDDVTGRTIVAASSRSAEFKGATGNSRDGAAAVGKLVAKKAKKAKIERVVFDRNGFLYHGRVAALADAAREAGLSF